MFELRWYQEEAVSALLNYNYAKNPLVAMPTGTGKSVVIAEFIKRALELYPTTRILMLTHVKELVEQNAEKLRGVWKNVPLGIYSAGLNSRSVGMPVTFGSMQSVYKHIQRQLINNDEHFGKVDLLIVDEAHLISDKDTTTYRKIISELYNINPYVKVVGLTATPYRMKSGMLTDCGIFGEIIYDLTQPDMFVRLIKEGYLAPLIPKRTSVEIDVSDVSINKDFEYNSKQLARVSDNDEITFNAVREIVECGIGQNRTSWIIFCTSIEHCEHVNAMLLSLGISSAVCHSELKGKQNDAVIEAFKQGKLTCLVNNNKLTTGFDNPKIDLIGMLRPTNSVGLWCQMLGRGTRPYHGKENCLVLDFAGNTKRLGCINDPNIPSRRKKGGGGTGDAPVKVCPECSCYNHAKARYCEVCGTEFTFKQNLFCTASNLELIKDTSPQYELLPVDQVIYNEHRSIKGGMPTLQVTYICGLSKYYEYVCFEHQGYSRKRAEMWWSQRSSTDCPDRVYEALGRADSLKKPSMITVHINKKYPEVKSVSF